MNDPQPTALPSVPELYHQIKPTGVSDALHVAVAEAVLSRQLKPEAVTQFARAVNAPHLNGADNDACRAHVAQCLAAPEYAGFRVPTPAPTPGPESEPKAEDGPAFLGSLAGFGMRAGQAPTHNPNPAPGSVEAVAAQMRQRQAALEASVGLQSQQLAARHAAHHAAAHQQTAPSLTDVIQARQAPALSSKTVPNAPPDYSRGFGLRGVSPGFSNPRGAKIAKTSF